MTPGWMVFSEELQPTTPECSHVQRSRRGAVSTKTAQGGVRYRNACARYQACPARTVVLEKLDKFNGEARVPITAGEYTQLTGRAGRRGIDDEGHSVIIWQPGINPEAVAALASRRSYPLKSSFAPTYNMAVNLIAQFGVDHTRSILESSFAQFQADRHVVELARQVRAKEESLQGYQEAMMCHLGDFAEYGGMRRELSNLERQLGHGSSGRGRYLPRHCPVAHRAVSPPLSRLSGSRVTRPMVRAVVEAGEGNREATVSNPQTDRRYFRHVHPRDGGAPRHRIPAGTRGRRGLPSTAPPCGASMASGTSW